MTTISGIAYVTPEGKLVISNRKRFAQDIANLKPGQYEYSFKRKNRRSDPQNRYYWGVVVTEIKLRLIQLGHTVDAETVHEFLKSKFNSKMLMDDQGVVIMEYGGSTAGLNKEEFSIYIEKIAQWAAEFLQIAIPLPGANNTLFDE